MKNRDLFLNIGIAVMIVVVITVVVFKFVVKPAQPELLKIKDIKNIELTDLAGNTIKLVDFNH